MSHHHTTQRLLPLLHVIFLYETGARGNKKKERIRRRNEDACGKEDVVSPIIIGGGKNEVDGGEKPQNESSE